VYVHEYVEYCISVSITRLLGHIEITNPSNCLSVLTSFKIVYYRDRTKVIIIPRACVDDVGNVRNYRPLYS
jgi:hypothetical protein